METFTQPKIIEKFTKEFDNLEKAVAILSKKVQTINFEIKTIYFDYGLNWMWTTIVAYQKGSNSSWQYLVPRDWVSIVTANNDEDIEKAVDMAIDLNKNLN